MEYKLEYVKPEDLTELPENPRKHPDSLIDKIEKSMSKFGFTAPILALKESKEIVAGHGRLKTAKKMQLDKVPVIFLDMDRKHALEYVIADNKLQQDSTWDFLKLNELFKDEEFDVDVTGFNDAEVKSIMEKFSVELEFIEGDNNDPIEQKVSVNENIPTANIKMLQLYFTNEDYTEVTNMCHRLMIEYNLENITDVVKTAIQNEHSKCK